MTHTTRSPFRARTALGALAVAALLALSACGGSASDADDPAAGSSSDAAPEAAGDVDLSGIPDVVAEVNGEEVTKEEFAPIYEAQLKQAGAQAQMGGDAPDEDALKKQTVDDLVDTELLTQEAESRGLEVTDDDVDAELTDLAEQNGLESADALLDAVAQQGMDEDAARAQVEVQLMVEQLVADEKGSLEPTEKQLRTLYARAKKQQEQSGGQGDAAKSFPSFAQARSQLAEQARAQEVGTAAQEMVTDLRKDADITINL